MLPALRDELTRLLASIDQMIAERESTRIADGDLKPFMLLAESLQGLYGMRESVEERLLER